MKYLKRCSIISFLCGLFLIQCQREASFLSSQYSYLGMEPPGKTPTIFAGDIISIPDGHEYCLAFSPDGKEIYFSRAGSGLIFTRWTGSEWTAPEKVAFSDKYVGGEAHITGDGKYLLMNRYAQLDSGEVGGIWRLQRVGLEWDHPQFLIPSGMRATSTTSKKIYTTDISGYQVEGLDGGIISKWLPVELEYIRDDDPGGGVNTDNIEAHPFIAPDESYILFNSRRPGGKGESDLYICYRSEDSTWSEAFSIESVNTEGSEWCATVSPDSRYMFFTRNDYDGGNIYWIETDFIKNYRRRLNPAGIDDPH